MLAESYDLDMATIHMTEAEAARDFEGLMDRVRAGAEVLIEKEDAPAVLVRSMAPQLSTPINELIERAEAREKERGYAVRMDPEFAMDMDEIVRNRKPRDISVWNEAVEAD